VQSQSYFEAMPHTDAVAELRSSLTSLGRGGVEVFSQFDDAQSVWRDMVQRGAICSRYQHYQWMSNWWKHIGNGPNTTPHIIVLRDGKGEPVLLLPLLRKRVGPIHVGMFLGGKHTNFNLAVWRPDLLNDPPAGIAALVDGLRGQGPTLDLLVLLNQPASWLNVPNPLLQLPHTLSPSQAYGGSLDADFEILRRERMGSSSRKKLGQKERQLAAAVGPVSYIKAETPAEIDRVLEVFFRQKAGRMHELGLSDAFDAPGVKEFVTAAAHEVDPDTGTRVIELYAACAGDTIIATFGGITANGRFSGMFNSMAGTEFRDYSPGELLLSHVVKCCCERGLNRFDLGIGEAAYKRVYCNDAEPLHDSIIPITVAGQVAAPIWRAGLALKSQIKKSDTMLRAIRSIRQITSRKTVA
jgi:CelD/BcsL family acetyltransferase involved in cellulose biosynthesis